MTFPYKSNLSINNYEPVYQSIFEIEFENSELSSNEIKFLSMNCTKIKDDILTFKLNSDFKITEILLKLKSDFNVLVKTYNKSGDVTSIFYLLDCLLIKPEKSMIDFDFESQDIIQYNMKFSYEKFNFFNLNGELTYENWKKNHERKKKFKNII